MKYRHLNKVPATPQYFYSADQALEPDSVIPFSGLKISDPLAGNIEIRTDSNHSVAKRNVGSVFDSVKTEFPDIESAPLISRHEPNLKIPIRRDWSLLIGLLFLAGGLIALSMCIFYYPFAGLNFLWTMVFELFTLYAAWRLLGSGIVYFITRFRSKRNFTER